MSVVHIDATDQAPALDGPADLRRVDWRFLLPRPDTGSFRQLVVLGGTPDIAPTIASTGLSREVVTTLDAATHPDAVVVLADSVDGIADAAARLCPGGVLYCEVDRRRRRWLTPRRLARMLRREGLHTEATYWVLPGFERALRFVPLARQAAVRWYLRDVFVQSSLPRTIAALVADTAARFGTLIFPALVPCFSLVAVRRGDASHGEPSGVAPGAPPGLAVAATSALITSGQDDGSRVVLLPFGADQRRPDRAIKIPRHPRYNDRTVGEHVTLTRLRTRLGPPLTQTVPSPVGLCVVDRLAVASESCAAGPSLLVSSSRWGAPLRRRIDDLRLATEWLVAFNRTLTVDQRSWSSMTRHRYVQQPVSDFARINGRTPERDRLFDAITRRSSELEGLSLPVVVQHNDFGPWNVHRDGERVTVIDWEVNGGDPETRHGLPMLDLVYFATHWLFASHRVTGTDERLRVFDGLALDSRDRLATAARRAWAGYVDALGIDRRFVPLLLALTWIERANDRMFRPRHDAAGREDPARARYVAYVDRLAAHVDEIFRTAARS